MATKVDPASWTGLAPDKPADVREHQHPDPGGPVDLPPVTNDWRLFDATKLPLVVAFAAPIGFLKLDNLAEWMVVTGLIGAAMMLTIALVQRWVRRREGFAHAIRLDGDGLHLPERHCDPVPWSRIGKVETHLWRGFRLIAVHVDDAHTLRIRAPFPLSRFGAPVIASPLKTFVISCWKIDADCNELRRDIERFRDNYCAADDAPETIA